VGAVPAGNSIQVQGEEIMNRRELLVGSAAAAATLLAKAAGADDHMHDMQGMHDMQHMHAARKFAALANAASDCVKTGQICADHCMEMFAAGDNSTAACARSVSQLLPICATLQQLAEQNSKYTQKYARFAQEVCRDCERECRKHEKEHEACRNCAESCAACAKECDAVAA
jgi:Cys-rich four helix bundle protein (predicted Tat secretion target)